MTPLLLLQPARNSPPFGTKQKQNHIQKHKKFKTQEKLSRNEAENRWEMDSRPPREMGRLLLSCNCAVV